MADTQEVETVHDVGPSQVGGETGFERLKCLAAGARLHVGRPQGGAEQHSQDDKDEQCQGDGDTTLDTVGGHGPVATGVAFRLTNSTTRLSVDPGGRRPHG
jgi:hypothetical protein